MEQDDFKNQLVKIKEAYNIVDLIEEENVSLKTSGPGRYKGLCPFHSEKTPSFVVDENFQSYRCFGCGVHGDIFKFIEDIRGCSFADAAKYLAEMKGIELKFSGSGKHENAPHIDIKAMYGLLQDSYDFYRDEYNKLPDTHPAKQEVISRGLDPNNQVFCYAPERFGALYKFLEQKGYSTDLMLQSELVSKSESGKLYDFFHSRLLITLSDFSGRPVSYSARKLFDSDTRAKYVNGKQSPIFQKEATLFNLDKAKKSIRETKKVIVCEGPFDVLALDKAGIENAVASCGTAFTEKQLRSIEQIVDVDGNVVFSFDGDDAGIKAAVHTFLHFPLIHGNSSVVLFPEGLDPCDYLVKYGAEKMNEPLSKEQPIIDFVLSSLASKLKLSDMQTRYQFAKLVMGKYAPAVTDVVLRNYMIRRTSVLSGVEVEELDGMLGKTPRQYKKEIQKDTPGDLEIQVNLSSDTDKCYVTLLAMLIHEPKLLFPKLKDIKIPDKFHNIIREIGTNCREYMMNKKEIRIIPEQYDEQNFIKYLQEFEIIIDYGDEKQVLHHFDEVAKIGQASVYAEEQQRRKQAIAQALDGAKSPEEIVKLLELADK